MQDTEFSKTSRKPLKLLVAEFLLANSDARRDASPSMLDEAAAMLKSVVEDVAALSDVQVTVLLNEEFDLFGTSEFSYRIHLHRDQLSSETFDTIVRGSDSQPMFHSVLLIAPECGGVLVSLLKAVQKSAASSILSLNLNWRFAEIFADKRATDTWLRRHQIPTIPTCTVDDATAKVLLENVGSELCVAGDERCVLKPRDGAGADGVQIVRLVNRRFQDLPQWCSDMDRWVLQPLMSGLACSVGFIGGGEFGPTTILPPARQNINVIDGKMSYCGGQIPCSPALADRMARISGQIADALGAFNGYVGVDLLVDCSVPDDSKESVCVVEINPRLCTSYVGYRTLAADNLAAFLLQQNVEPVIRWNPGVVRFSAGGSVSVVSQTSAAFP